MAAIHRKFIRRRKAASERNEKLLNTISPTRPRDFVMVQEFLSYGEHMLEDFSGCNEFRAGTWWGSRWGLWESFVVLEFDFDNHRRKLSNEASGVTSTRPKTFLFAVRKNSFLYLPPRVKTIKHKANEINNLVCLFMCFVFCYSFLLRLRARDGKRSVGACWLHHIPSENFPNMSQLFQKSRGR